MANDEKVLKAWECCDPLNRRCFECPYEDDCFHDSFDRVAIADMVKLLKSKQGEIDELTEKLEQKCEICANKMLKAEPRVMTFCEVYNLEPEVYFVDFRGNIAVYVALADRHYKVTIGDYVPEPRTVFIGEDRMFVVKDSDYGKRWRCWTARPSKEQREAEPWKDYDS